MKTKWEHYQNIIWNSRIFTILRNKNFSYTKNSLVSHSGLIYLGPRIRFDSEYRVVSYNGNTDSKIIGYNTIIITNLVKNHQGKQYPFDLKDSEEWKEILDFYRDIFNRRILTFDDRENIQDFISEQKEYQRIKT